MLSERLRPKSKWSFVLLMTVVFTISQVAGQALFDWLWGDPIQVRLRTVIINVIFGLAVGLIILWVTPRLSETRKISGGPNT